MPRFFCDQCPLDFASKSGLCRHKSNKHKPTTRNQIKKRTCTTCNKLFATLGSLKIHIKEQHSNSRRRQVFTCSACPKTFKTKRSQSAHLKTHSIEWKRCEVCNVDYKYQHKCKQDIFSRLKSAHIANIKADLENRQDPRPPTYEDVKKTLISVLSQNKRENIEYKNIIKSLKDTKNAFYFVYT